MKRSTFENYLRRVENNDQYSGMTGEDIYGQMSSAAGQGGPSADVPEPYVLQIQNTTGEKANALVFGYNDNINATNFGSAAGITITNLQGGTYERLLNQSQNLPFEIGLMRFQSSSTDQLAETVTLTFVDANGMTCSKPIPLSIYKDAYQEQGTILDIQTRVTVNGNTEFTIPILANTTLTLTFFPKELVNVAKPFTGRNPVQTYKQVQLSGKNRAVVNVNTGNGARVGKNC